MGWQAPVAAAVVLVAAAYVLDRVFGWRVWPWRRRRPRSRKPDVPVRRLTRRR